MDTIYFEAQTGLIRDTLNKRSIFYQYILPASMRSFVETAANNATLVDTHMVYEPGFLDRLEAEERKHIRAMANRDRWF
jgi:hypothetical protein